MDERYKDINKRLRRLLAEERKSLQQVRQNYALELSARTELELLLRRCVEDVRKEIARRKIEASAMAGSDLVKLYSRNPGAIPVDDFLQEDRERAIELLLSQERVITLLYAKTFPVVNKQQSGGATLEGSSGAAVAAAVEALASRPHTQGSSSTHLPSIGGNGGGPSQGRPHTGQGPDSTE